MYKRSQSSIVSTVSKLQDGEFGARILEGARGFSPLQNTQISSGCHTPSYSMSNGGSFSGIKCQDDT
jgi:hypothetical protein